jgi:hypothetical protein
MARWNLGPNERGTKVRRMQKALANNSFARALGQGAGFAPGPIDGEMGPKTQAALRDARYAVGFASRKATEAETDYELLAILEKRRQLSAKQRERRVRRIERYQSSVTDEQRLLEVADYWYVHRAASRYSYPTHNPDRMTCPEFPGVAPWTDCSGMVRCMWWQLNQMQPGRWPDPARADYAVWGNSDSFILNARNFGKFIPLGSAQTGDIACYVGGVGHAELVTKRGTVLTNGSEAGPYYRPIAQHSGRLYICRLAPFV